MYGDGGVPNRAQIWVERMSGSEETGKPPETVQIFTHGIATDDRGVYRVPGLPKGKYRISIWEGVQVFAPDALKASDARAVSVDEGDVISDVDITIPNQLFHSIGGIVMRGGTPIANANVILVREGETRNRDSVNKPDGSFHFDMVLPGTYTIEVEYPAPGSEVYAPSLHGKITVQLIDSDITDADVELLGQASGD
jgi:hypothetical protein